MNTSISRRSVLRAGGAAAVAASAGLLASRAWSQQRKLTFAWNATAFCLSPVVVAQERGIFEKNGLQVDLINYTARPISCSSRWPPRRRMRPWA